MGLFDFIKKKLFGKTKKAEDSKKAPEKKLEKRRPQRLVKKLLSQLRKR